MRSTTLLALVALSLLALAPPAPAAGTVSGQGEACVGPTGVDWSFGVVVNDDGTAGQSSDVARANC
jgi:hypothetical protein